MRTTAGTAPVKDGESQPAVPGETLAEAAVWVTRLHGPNRSRAMELECLAWQQRSEAHRQAFERCTNTWQAVSGVTLTGYAAAAERSGSDTKRAQRLRRWGLCLASVAGAWIAIYGCLSWRGSTYETAVGEQRSVMLQDGSRLSLNTATRVRVQLTGAQRTVTLEDGEALFEVAKDPNRPFVVSVADKEVVATGTSFLVRSTASGSPGGEQLDVTLIQGQVIVRDGANHSLSSLTPATVMVPGERLRLDQARTEGTPEKPVVALLERSRLEQALSWRRGEAIFDGAPLFEAVSEMNRYSKEPIVLVGGDALSALRVSGVFRTGDSAGFVAAVAKLHGLVTRNRGGRLELAAS